ncbi:MAG TPA: DUF4389 domain-containing protein [Dehalococcoidia bacterium]|nr:DUF4389 domain-containing protein [Dehalococcoidia bacterium]
MATYGVAFDVERQASYDRVHVAIRLAIIIVAGILGAVTGGLISGIFGALYIIVPVAAAILIAQKGAQKYFEESEQNMTRWLRYLIGFYAYMGLLTDTLPNQDQTRTVRFGVTPTGTPSAGQVLLRIILAIPSAIVLGLLGIVAFVLSVIAAIMILVGETYPEGIFNFLRGWLRWEARIFAYLAGLVQEYPPFAFDTGPEAPGASPTPGGSAPSQAT